MSRRSLGTLTIDLIARTGGFQEGMSRAEREADRATKSISRGSRSASKDVQALGSSANSSAEFFKRFASIAGTAIAGIKLTSLIRESADLNSRYEQLGGIMTVVGRNAGISAGEVNNYAAEVRAMGITMLESRQTVISMTQAQLDLSKASDLARVAQDAAAVAGINSTEALGRLINGIQSANTQVLRGVGINVQFEQGYRDMAAQLGKTSAELTEAEKAQSRMNQVLAAGADIAGSYESSMDSATKQLGSTARYVEDLKVMWGELFSEANRQLVFQYSDGLKALLGVTEALYQDGRLEEWGESVGRGLDIATDAAQALAVVLGARLAGSLSAVIAAKALAIQQTVAYQFALGRMAGVSAAAVTGQYALASAVGAARGAFALIGGPVGAAVIAASAIFYFREELGLVPPDADRASAAIRGLTEDMDDLTAAAARNRLIELEKGLDKAETAVNVLQGSFDYLSDDLERRPDNWRVAQQLDKVTEELEEQEKLVREYRDAIKDMQRHLQRAVEGYSTKEEILAQIAKEYGNAADGAKDLADGTDEAARKSKELERQLQRVLDKLYPQKAAVRDLMAEWKLVSELAPQSTHDWIDANIMIGTTIREAADESVVAVERHTTATERGAERMRDVMGDYFQRLIVDGKASFSDLVDLFKRMIAEMIATAAANRIILGVGLGGGSSIASAGSLLGGGGGGGAGGGLLNLASWASGAKTLWSGATTLLGGGGLSGFGGRFAMSAFESNTLHYGLEAAMQAEQISSFMQGAGTWIAGVAGAIQGWRSGNKLNAITGAAGGVYGMKGGATVGSYFGPIGTVVGAAIGTVLGSSLGSSVFGGGWENRRSGIQLGFDDDGLMLEDWIRQTKKGGLFGSTKRRYRYSEMEEAMAAEFQTGYDAMIDVLGNQFLAIGADLDRAVFEGVKIGSASINTSDQTEEQIQEQIEKWFNDLNAAMIKGALNAAGDTSAAVRLLRATGGDVAMLEALGGLMGVAAQDAVAAARAAHTQLTMVESYRTVTDATRTLIGEYDGSLDATYALTEAMGIQQELAYGLASAYLQANDAVGLLFGNLSETIRTSLMDAEELYEYQRGQVHSLTDMLSTLTDPEAIMRTSEQIERLVSGMWGRLDETQRVALGDEFLDYVDRTQALAQDRLAQGLADVESAQADVYSALTAQMDTVADRMIAATERIQSAAELQYQSSMQFGAYVQQMGSIVQSMGWGREVNA